MLYTEISQKKTSRLIMGTDYMGTLVPDNEVMSLFDMYFDLGGNHFDTAHMYCAGLSEMLIGRWLKTKKREDIFVSTKGGFPYEKVSRLDAESLRRDIEESLMRLDTDCVDLYYLHRDDTSIPAGEIIETLNSFIKEGKTVSIGCSNWKASRIKEANTYAKEHGLNGFVVSEIKWSLAKTSEKFNDDPTLVEMNEAELEFYKNSDLKVTAFAPQAKGFFSKYEKGALDEKVKDRYLCDENIERYIAAKEIAQSRGVSIAAIVISYLMSQKNPVTLPVVGCKNTTQLKDTAAFSDLMLTDDELNKLNRSDLL